MAEPLVLIDGSTAAMFAPESDSAMLAARAISMAQSNACVAKGPGGSNGVSGSVDSACGATPSIISRVASGSAASRWTDSGERSASFTMIDVRFGMAASLSASRNCVPSLLPASRITTRAPEFLTVVDLVDADLVALTAGERDRVGHDDRHVGEGRRRQQRTNGRPKPSST